VDIAREREIGGIAGEREKGGYCVCERERKLDKARERESWV
jgi:hypothetical protein